MRLFVFTGGGGGGGGGGNGTYVHNSIVALHQILDSDDNDFQVVQQQYEYCSCDKYNYLIGILYVLKGSIVLFGLFLAYETRNVDYKYMNDAKYVSFATYVVVIVVGIGAPLSLVLTQNWLLNSAYGLAVVMIITACLSCLLILYVPKVSLYTDIVGVWVCEEDGMRCRTKCCSVQLKVAMLADCLHGKG